MKEREETNGEAMLKAIVLVALLSGIWVWLFANEPSDPPLSAHMYALGECMADLYVKGEIDVSKTEAICRSREDRQH